MFHAKYSKQKDGQYPRMPDGSRMRFVPASHFLDMTQRQTATDLMKLQIWYQSNTILAPIPISNPNQRFPTQENKTMNELILDLKSDEKDQEPFFRHIKKKWTRDYDERKYEVSIHTNVYPDAADVLRNLKEVLEREYGKEVADAIGGMTEEEEEELGSSAPNPSFTLEKEDRYLHGKGKFIFEGLERVESRLATEQQREERSLHVRSTTSGLTDHQTVASGDNATYGQTENSAEWSASERSGEYTNQPQDRENHGFVRIGTVEDERRLMKQIGLAQPHDPGGGKGGMNP